MHTPRVTSHPKQLVGGRDSQLLGRLLYAGRCLVSKAIVTKLEKRATKFTQQSLLPPLLPPHLHPSQASTPPPSLYILTYHKPLLLLPLLHTHSHSPQASNPPPSPTHTYPHHKPPPLLYKHLPSLTTSLQPSSLSYTHTPSLTSLHPSSLPYTHTLTHHKSPPFLPPLHTLTHHKPPPLLPPLHTLTHHKLIPTEQPAVGKVDLREIRAGV